MTSVASTLIVGSGISARACLRYLRKRGEPVVVCDTRSEAAHFDDFRAQFPDVTLFTGGIPGEALRAAQRIVISPGVDRRIPQIGEALANGIPVIGELDLFAQAANAPVIGITGTNGKSTVTALVGSLLEGLGVRVAIGGNLGTPALDLLDDDAQWYVLELSSFQLESADSLTCEIGAVLNISDDHMDRYDSLLEYACVKKRIYADVQVAVYNMDDERSFPPEHGAVRSGGRSMTFGLNHNARYRVERRGSEDVITHRDEVLLNGADITLKGQHNLLNIAAALAIIDAAGMSVHDALQQARQFSGLPHRCQLVGTVGGVQCIDDSKATNPGAVTAALRGLDASFKRNIVLIAGGQGKGFDYATLVAPVSDHVHSVVLIGEEATALQRALSGTGARIVVTETLLQAVETGLDCARSGDILLLSPACASFDMFDSFAARGAAFSAAVAEQEQNA